MMDTERPFKSFSPSMSHGLPPMHHLQTHGNYSQIHNSGYTSYVGSGGGGNSFLPSSSMSLPVTVSGAASVGAPSGQNAQDPPYGMYADISGPFTQNLYNHHQFTMDMHHMHEITLKKELGDGCDVPPVASPTVTSTSGVPRNSVSHRNPVVPTSIEIAKNNKNPVGGCDNDMDKNIGAVSASRSKVDSKSDNDDILSHKRIRNIPEERKDGTYWEKRKKNNESAKRSRDSRRMKEEQIAMRVMYLEQENLQLRTEVTLLRTETEKLRCMLYNT